jgi:hypothetical protein
MMYAEVGATLEGDAYEINAPGVPREVVKRAFNKLVNASGRTMPTPGFYEGNYGLSWAKLLDLVIARHEPIAQFLGTGYGVYLQCKDAQIANQIMMRFLDMRYLCLPVHDSFIVHAALEDDLTEIMRDEFLKQTGAHIRTSPKFDVTRLNTRGEGAIDMSDPTEILKPRGKYTGHEAINICVSVTATPPLN